jgi:putative hydrolase of the HAD superfamily
LRRARFSALLLDFGGVCLRNPVELHRQVEATLGLAPLTLTWMGPLAPATDRLWQAMQQGELSEREYWQRRAADIGRAAGRRLTLAQYMAACFDRPEEEIIRPEAVEVVAAARRKGVRVGLLTNDLEAFHGREWKQRIAFLRELDSFTDASVTGVLKPDPRAYAQALAGLGAAPGEVLFVDDQPGNVEGARRLGIESFRFDVAHPQGSWQQVRALVLSSASGCGTEVSLREPG